MYTTPILGLPVAEFDDPTREYPETVDAPAKAILDTVGVPRFANAAARDAAVPAPVEGQSCYLKDTGTLQMHNGYVWVGDTAFKTLTVMLNGWAAHESKIRMDHTGFVQLLVLVQGPGTIIDIATLPVNYKPSSGAELLGVGWVWTGAMSYARLGIGSGTLYILGHSVPLNTISLVGGLLNYQADFKAVR